MDRGLFIDRGPLETRVALIEQSRIAEIHIESAEPGPGRPGEIRKGRVTHVSGELQAATVDAGEGLSLFVRAADARVLAADDAGARKLSIAKLVRRGQDLLVQTGREGLDGKQGRASADIALHGRYLSFHPLREGLDFPKAVAGLDLRETLGAALTDAGGAGRILVHPAASQVEIDVVLAELRRLRAEWVQIEAARTKGPALVLPAPDLIEQAFIRLAGPSPEAILTPDRGLLAELRQRAKALAPDLADRIELCEASRSLELDDEIDAALAPEVVLPGGGRLTIETTRAMTTVDVDAPGDPVKANLAAARELARQLRLRRIGGVVAVDFISLRGAPERKKVEKALRQAFQRDPAQVEIGGIDRFSILTLTRSRDAAALLTQLCETAPARQHLRPEAALARVLRRIEAELAGVGPVPVALTLSAELRPVVGSRLAGGLDGLLGRPVRLGYDALAVDEFRLSRER
ncbi:MAG: hypothetical protein TEF_12525 [Rhizobiales bacterium NRL2]|jgi:Rne/Rng family ribonuclease|nr:MAG: hypothetical protein TEF_12525 [Rhizobiales bacterium NRL2]